MKKGGLSVMKQYKKNDLQFVITASFYTNAHWLDSPDLWRQKKRGHPSS